MIEVVFDVHTDAGVVVDRPVLVGDPPLILALWFLKVLVLRESQKRTEIWPLAEEVSRQVAVALLILAFALTLAERTKMEESFPFVV